MWAGWFPGGRRPRRPESAVIAGGAESSPLRWCIGRCRLSRRGTWAPPYGTFIERTPVGQGPCALPHRKRHIGGPPPLQALSVTFGDSSPIGRAKSGTPAKKDAEPGGSASLGCVISQYSGSFSSRRIWGRAASSPCSFSSRSHRSSRSLVPWLMRMWSLDF